MPSRRARRSAPSTRCTAAHSDAGTGDASNASLTRRSADRNRPDGDTVAAGSAAKMPLPTPPRMTSLTTPSHSARSRRWIARAESRPIASARITTDIPRRTNSRSSKGPCTDWIRISTTHSNRTPRDTGRLPPSDEEGVHHANRAAACGESRGSGLVPARSNSYTERPWQWARDRRRARRRRCGWRRRTFRRATGILTSSG